MSRFLGSLLAILVLASWGMNQSEASDEARPVAMRDDGDKDKDQHDRRHHRHHRRHHHRHHKHGTGDQDDKPKS